MLVWAMGSFILLREALGEDKEGRMHINMNNHRNVNTISPLLASRPRALHESKHMDIPAGMRETMERTCNQSQVYVVL